MNMSPEFHRNLWLELGSHRLVGMPGVLGGIFFLVYVLSGNRLSGPLSTVALASYLVLTILWGTRLASEAVVGEIRDRTWDIQRMSAITPWSMTWGKLLGSTIYPWYGAVMCLAVYAATVFRGLGTQALKEMLLLLLAGVFAQTVALLVSLHGIRRKFVYGRSAATTYWLIGAASVVPFLRWGLSEEYTVDWFGSYYPPLDFALISLLVFLGWALAGAYRHMRTELQLRNGPLVWMAFVLFVVCYAAGFVDLPGVGSELVGTIRLFEAYSAMLIITYVMALSERKDPVAFQRLLEAAKQRQWRRLLVELPCWLVTMSMVLIFAAFLAARDYPAFSYGVEPTNLNAFVLATSVFLVRDVGLVLYFNLGDKPNRADAAALLYLIILYFLAPAIFAALHWSAFVAALVPWHSGQPGVTLVAGAGQVALVLWLTTRRWRRQFATRIRI